MSYNVLLRNWSLAKENQMGSGGSLGMCIKEIVFDRLFLQARARKPLFFQVSMVSPPTTDSQSNFLEGTAFKPTESVVCTNSALHKNS